MGVYIKKVVSEEKKVSMLPRDHFYGILIKNVAPLCPCPKSVPEDKVWRF